MRLHELGRRLTERGLILPAGPLPDVEVIGIQEDSRRIRSGDVFVARRGTGSDGKSFVADAHRAGAVAVIADGPVPGSPVPVLRSDAAGHAAGVAAHTLHGDPTQAFRLVGVTGTNGKTTTTFLLRHLARAAAVRCGLVGTCECDDGSGPVSSSMTTPGPVAFADLCAGMARNGCRASAVEVSSHALTQGRVAGASFAGAGFTNLSGDHLDYHGTMQAYADAKSLLFADLPPGAPAVVNAQDAWSDRMVRGTRGRVVRFRTDSGIADWWAEDVDVTADGTTFVLHAPCGVTRIKMTLIGRHNVENAVCAAALAGEVLGIDLGTIADGLADAAGAPGRLQRVDVGQPFAVLVDYAHTDDALENVLRALRGVTRGRLRVIFGCGGDRDRTKRPRMARVAESVADDVYVTSDNPRTESPDAIIEDILAGFTRPQEVRVEADRRKAIRQALCDARAADVVLIAGKGHENYQIVGSQRFHFDDAEEAVGVLESLCGCASAA